MTETAGPNLYQRIRAVGLEVKEVEKTGKTQHGNAATSIGDVENAVRDAMFKHGIITRWSRSSLVEVPERKQWRAHFTVIVTNADDPTDSFNDDWEDVGANTLAAASFCRKGYYKALFHLTGDEDEDPKPASEAAKPGQAKKNSKPDEPATNGPVNVEHEKLLDRVNESLKALSGKRQTTGKKLITEWMNETNVKVTGFSAMNNAQLSDLLAWSDRQLQPETPESDAELLTPEPAEPVEMTF